MELGPTSAALSLHSKKGRRRKVQIQNPLYSHSTPHPGRPIPARKLQAILLEGWQPERIAAILDAKHAHEEAIHAEQHGAPDDHRRLLGLGVLDARHAKGQVDCGEGKEGV